MIGLTGAIAFFGLCSVIVGVLQWRSMNGQLKEMQRGGTDTHELAVQAKNQADRTKDVADQMKLQADRTKDMADQAKNQATATNNLARSANRQANIAADTLAAHERPWIGYDHINIPDKIAKGSTASSSLIYKNWGSGPALHVTNEYQISEFCGGFPAHPPYNISESETPTMLMPGQVTETGKTSFTAPITDEVLAVIKKPNCGLYVYARITFRDKASHLHWRHFCGKWDSRTDTTFTVCNAYNDGDEDYADGKEP